MRGFRHGKRHHAGVRENGSFAPRSVRLASRFEQLDRIAVGIFQLDLFAARAYFHLIAKMKPSVLQRLNPRRKIANMEDHPVPAAGFLLATIWHWPGTRSPGTAENEFEIPN